MSILLSNKLLQAAEAKIENDLTPQNRDDYMKIVVAGMHFLLRGGPNGVLAKLKGRSDPVHDCALGAVNLVLILKRESKGVMPLKAMVPAGMTIMLKALDFAEKIGKVKVDNDTLVRAAHIFTNTLMQRFHITAPMLSTAMQRVHGIMSDPQKMAQINMKAGVTKHPNAAPLPAAAPSGDTDGAA